MCQALFQCFLNTVSQNHQVQSYLLQEHRKKWALKWMRSNRNTLLCHGPHCLFEKGNAIKGDVWNEMVSVCSYQLWQHPARWPMHTAGSINIWIMESSNAWISHHATSCSPLPLHTLYDDFFTTDKQPGSGDHQNHLPPPAEQQNQRRLLGHYREGWWEHSHWADGECWVTNREWLWGGTNRSRGPMERRVLWGGTTTKTLGVRVPGCP